VDKIRAMKLFDGGYEKLRETIFENQKRLGVIPKDTKLAPWPKDMLQEWDKLTADERKLFIRQVESSPPMPPTAITRSAAWSRRSRNSASSTTRWSSTSTATTARPPRAVRWARRTRWRSSTVSTSCLPKCSSSSTTSGAPRPPTTHVSGVVVGLRHAVLVVQAERLGAWRHQPEHGVSWPARIKDKGGLREQFVHVIDVVPTILDAAGIRAPEVVDGIKQAPIEGTSFAYTFDAKNAKASTRHKTQYFEMFGQWALYDDGWFLSTKVNRAPWKRSVRPTPTR